MNPRVQNWLSDTGLFLIRVILAAVFMYHGSQKLFGAFGGPGLAAFAGMLGNEHHVPLPWLGAFLSASTEFFGGLALLVGFYVRLAAIPMAFNMAVACAMVHAQNGFGGPKGMEYPLTLGVVLFSLILLGSGRFCVDRMIPWVRISAVQQSIAE